MTRPERLFWGFKSVVAPLNLRRFKWMRRLNQSVFRVLEEYDPELREVPELCRILIRQGDLAIDIGANEGVVSREMLKATNRVIAFEPNPELIPRLRRIEGLQVSAVALWDRSGAANLYTLSGNSGLSSLAEDAVKIAATDYDLETPRTFIVPVRTLDEYDLDADFIKIDAQGADFKILRGAKRTIRRYHPTIVVEVAPRLLEKFGDTAEAMEAWLRKRGYALLRAYEGNTTVYYNLVAIHRGRT